MSPWYHKQFQSWGRLNAAPSRAISTSDPQRLKDALSEENGKILAYGLGRSYGDSCLNSEGDVIETTGMNKLISFDPDAGLLTAEAGISLDEVLRVIVPRGCFLPTTPGTKFITLGGAVANDVHGKNHHVAGAFGNNVIQFSLLRSDGSLMVCSRENNKEWFHATIGGLGLTGLIIDVTLQLKKISSSHLDVKSIPFRNIDEFFEISQNHDGEFEHSVSWIDCLSKGASLGRGIYMGGNHATNGELSVHTDPKASIPFNAPSLLLSPFNIRLFNAFYYNLQKAKRPKGKVHYDPFFYPLDTLNNWNKLYGKQGFFQYQSVIPHEHALETTRAMLSEISHSKQGSFLAVLKRFGDIPSDGMLSFSRPGITLALDFPNNGMPVKELFNRLDKIVKEASGCLYPAKDSRMTDFASFYPQILEFEKFIDPKFSSDFWQRCHHQK